MPEGGRAAEGGVFDACLSAWLAARDGRIGVKIAAEFARLSHPWEVPGIHDSLQGVLATQSVARGNDDFFAAAFTSVGSEANGTGRIDREVLVFFALAALYAASVRPFQGGPTFVEHPLTVTFRVIASGDDVERVCLLEALDGARQSLDEYVDWNGQRSPDEAAIASLGWTAAKEAVRGEFDDAAVERVAEELDRIQPPGWSLIRKQPFVESLGAMLGERWGAPPWQMVRHVLVEPRR